MLKTALLALAAALFCSTSGYAQGCMGGLKDGGKITVTAVSWANPYLYDSKFQKGKEEQKLL